ncbi:hypothetical protein RQP46_004855 [Phenoliferia psychrophenolica]
MSQLTPPAHLLPDYDPKSSKVAQLRGILLQHDVPFNSAAKKQELMDEYEAHVRPRAPGLLKELLAVRASDLGVLDGESQDGASLHDLDTDPEEAVDDEPPPRAIVKKAKGTKVRSRKSAAVVALPKEDDDLFMNDDQPEVPRSKVRKLAVKAPAEDDREEKVGLAVPTGPEEHKRAKADTPSVKDRRQSFKMESGGESGFSDFNPFQSGNEESPEAKPRRRKSSMGPIRPKPSVDSPAPATHKLKPRQSMPATVGAWASSSGTPPSPAPPLPNTPIGYKFMAPLERVKRSPPEVVALQREYAKMERERLQAEEEEAERLQAEQEELEAMQDDYELEPEPEMEMEMEPEPVVETVRSRPTAVRWKSEPEQLHTPSLEGSRHEIRKTPATKQQQVASAAPRQVVTPRQSSTPLRRSSLAPPRTPAEPLAVSPRAKPKPKPKAFTQPATPIVTPARLLVAFPLLLVAFLVWTQEKLALGYCDTASSSNALVASRPLSLVLPSFTSYTPPQALVSLLDATHLRPSCTACPAHGHCDAGALTACDDQYVARAHPLGGSFLPLPAKCVPDTEKQLAVLEVASAIAAKLRARRGEVVCDSRMKASKERTSKEEAFVYGREKGTLEDEMKQDNMVSGRQFQDAFLSELLRLAEYDLLSHDEAISVELLGANDKTEVWIASKSKADMPLSCRARLALTECGENIGLALVAHAGRHTSLYSSLLALALLSLWTSHKLRSRRETNALVASLVTSTLSHLRDQERRHYLDPALAPTAHLAPAHLRDLLIPHTSSHSSASERNALWSKVEKIVEANANVRAKEVEHLGEEIRGWEWTGVAGDVGPEKSVRKMYPKLG